MSWLHTRYSKVQLLFSSTTALIQMHCIKLQCTDRYVSFLTERVSDLAFGWVGCWLVMLEGGNKAGRQADGSDGCSQQCTTVLYVAGKELSSQLAHSDYNCSLLLLNYTTDTRLASCRRWMEIGEEGDL